MPVHATQHFRSLREKKPVPLSEERLRELAEKIPDDKLLFAVGRIRLEPGDILVVKTKLLLDKDQIAYISEQVRNFVPDNRVMVLTADLDLAVLSAQEARDGR
jgi:hypothetical protein